MFVILLGKHFHMLNKLKHGGQNQKGSNHGGVWPILPIFKCSICEGEVDVNHLISNGLIFHDVFIF